MWRAFDILFGAVACVLLSPMLLPIVLLLRFSGEGEIFYRQERIGLCGRRFGLIKFATMKKNSPNIGTGTLTVKNDPRILPMGHFLRQTKINELPQILNILVGDMSLIGPRPLTQQAFDAYSEDIKRILVSVRPGLSGVGSIIFRGEEDLLRDEEKSLNFYRDVIAPYKGSLERWFVENRDLSIYFCAIALTVWVVIFPKSQLQWKVFSKCPKPPPQIAEALGYYS